MKSLNFKFILLLVILVFLFPLQKTKVVQKSFAANDPMLFVSHCILDFNRCTRDSNPTMKFIISNFYIENGDLQGTLKSSANWIKLSNTSFVGDLIEITVKLELSELPLNIYKEKIEIETNAGKYTLPVRVDLVEKKTIVQFIIDNPFVLINGKQVNNNIAPIILHSKVWVPLRIICESFGAAVFFEGTHEIGVQKVNILYKDLKIQFIKDANYMLVNGNKHLIEYPYLVRFNLTFVTVDVIKDAFGAETHFNSCDRSLTIIY